MKNLVASIITTLLVLYGGQVVFAGENQNAISENSPWYISGQIGLANQPSSYKDNWDDSHEFDNGPNFSFSAGYDWEKFRVEGELSYRKMDYDRYDDATNTQGDQTQYQFMINAICQPKPNWVISPFVGAGFGYMIISWNDVSGSTTIFVDDSDNAFTYQLLGGVSYKITSKLFLDIIYKYIRSQDIEMINSVGTASNIDHQRLNVFALGLRYRF